MIFFHLEKSYSVKRHEIPKRPEAFAKGLEKIFGAGASVLERLIMRSLCSKLGLEYEDLEDRPFADYVKHVKEADDTKEAREDDRRSGSSSDKRSQGVRSFQQSGVRCVQMENSFHFCQ